MQVSLSIENLPIQERMSLVRQVWDSIVADAQKNTSDNPVNKQELRQFIDELPDIPNEPTQRQQSFLKWRENYEKSMAEIDDGWTDADHDAIWNNVRDRNDTGRDVIFEE